MNRILLDTTYILPLLGVDVEVKGLKENFIKVLENYEVYYNPISLIETKFIVLQLLKNGVDVLEDYKIGLNRILLEDRLKQTPLTNPEIETVADSLLIDRNIKDYFDRMIYATATALGLTLVTEDKDLIKLANDYPLKPPNVLSWKSLCKDL